VFISIGKQREKNIGKTLVIYLLQFHLTFKIARALPTL